METIEGNDVLEFSNTAMQKAELEIRGWLLSYLSELLDLEVDQIEVTDSFASLGLDSSAGVGMVADLANWLNRDLDTDLIYRHPTVESLAGYLASGGNR